VILAGVWSIMAAFGMASSPPAWFIGFEAAILVGCGLLTFRIDASMLLAAPRRYLRSDGEVRPKRPKRDLEGVAGFVLLFAYALQFAALVPLLRDTGGPVTSPFGQLIVAFAIFAPFIANNWITSVTVLVTTIAFYATLIVIYGFGHAGNGASVWTYFAVNVMILVLAVVVTVADLMARDGQPPDQL